MSKGESTGERKVGGEVSNLRCGEREEREHQRGAPDCNVAESEKEKRTDRVLCEKRVLAWSLTGR